MRSAFVCCTALVSLALAPALAQTAGAGFLRVRSQAAAPLSLSWDTAFADSSGQTPVHFVATYVDGNGQSHRLEEWRAGHKHLRRLTDARIDLHADAASDAKAGQPLDYVWQILDLKTHINHRISSQGMLRLGMLYNFYSMAHGLSRPAGNFQVHAIPVDRSCTWRGQHAEELQIDAAGQPSQRVCWLRSAGVPLWIEQQSGPQWQTTLRLQQVDTNPIAPSTFAVQTAGFVVRNVDEAEADD